MSSWSRICLAFSFNVFDSNLRLTLSLLSVLADAALVYLRGTVPAGNEMTFQVEARTAAVMLDNLSWFQYQKEPL